MGDVLADRVRHYRQLRQWSVRQLAEECARLGASKLTSSSLANIERGQAEGAKRQRRQVDVEELVVLARALQVPPVLLLFPVGRADEVELVPGTNAWPWSALRWFIGEVRFPSPYIPAGEPQPPGHLPEWIEDPKEGWEQWAAPALLFREHERLEREWWAIPPRLRELPFGTPEEKQATRDALWARVMTDLRRVHKEMRRHGLTPPSIQKEILENSERPDQGN